MYKVFKFKLYPTDEQRITLNKFIGASRFIYNYYLDKKINLYNERKITYTLKEMKKDLVPLQNEYEWLKEIDSCILRTTLENLDNAYEHFFKYKSGFPKFKCKNKINTYRTNCIRSTYKNNHYSNIKIDLENRNIKLPKIGKIQVRGYRNLNNFEKKIINVTISKEANKYYAYVCVEEDFIFKKIIPKTAIGIDLGVKDLAITSDGIKYAKMSFIERMEKRLKGLQKALSRSLKGSKNRYKLIIKIQRLYLKIKNARKFYIHKITSKLVKNNDLIIIENLQIKEMLSKGNHILSNKIQNSSFRKLINTLEYKCIWNNKTLIKVDKYYPSSKTCNRCGSINKSLELSDRNWVCSECDNNNNRDLNASINILNEGIKKYYKEQLN